MSDVTVVGNNVADIKAKLSGDRWNWLTINPQHARDYGRIPSLGFIVEWKKGNEHFCKEVPNEKALLKLITPLIRDYTLYATTQLAAMEAARKQEKRAAVDAARKALRAAEKAARE